MKPNQFAWSPHVAYSTGDKQLYLIITALRAIVASLGNTNPKKSQIYEQVINILAFARCFTELASGFFRRNPAETHKEYLRFLTAGLKDFNIVIQYNGEAIQQTNQPFVHRENDSSTKFAGYDYSLENPWALQQLLTSLEGVYDTVHQQSRDQAVYSNFAYLKEVIRIAKLVLKQLPLDIHESDIPNIVEIINQQLSLIKIKAFISK